MGPSGTSDAAESHAPHAGLPPFPDGAHRRRHLLGQERNDQDLWLGRRAAGPPREGRGSSAERRRCRDRAPHEDGRVLGERQAAHGDGPGHLEREQVGRVVQGASRCPAGRTTLASRPGGSRPGPPRGPPTRTPGAPCTCGPGRCPAGVDGVRRCADRATGVAVPHRRAVAQADAPGELDGADRVVTDRQRPRPCGIGHPHARAHPGHRRPAHQGQRLLPPALGREVRDAREPGRACWRATGAGRGCPGSPLRAWTTSSGSGCRDPRPARPCAPCGSCWRSYPNVRREATLLQPERRCAARLGHEVVPEAERDLGVLGDAIPTRRRPSSPPLGAGSPGELHGQGPRPGHGQARQKTRPRPRRPRPEPRHRRAAPRRR
jgi:hypothetical protein